MAVTITNSRIGNARNTGIKSEIPVDITLINTEVFNNAVDGINVPVGSNLLVDNSDITGSGRDNLHISAYDHAAIQEVFEALSPDEKADIARSIQRSVTADDLSGLLPAISIVNVEAAVKFERFINVTGALLAIYEFFHPILGSAPPY